jgi:hypothetical protein
MPAGTPQKMTLEKFQRTVLPSALEVFFKVPAGRAQFYGLTTAVHPDAPPIFQWDGLDGYPRNPVSWYVYDKGSWAKGWGLTAGAWAKVTAVVNRMAAGDFFFFARIRAARLNPTVRPSNG